MAHRREWKVKGRTARSARSLKFEFLVYAVSENQARQEAEDTMIDWSTGQEYIESIEPTGFMLIHESELKPG